MVALSADTANVRLFDTKNAFINRIDKLIGGLF